MTVTQGTPATSVTPIRPATGATSTVTTVTRPPAAPPATALAVPDPRRWRMLPVILSAIFMAMFDFFVVNVAAPSLQHDLHANDAALEFVVGGYAFTYAGGLITGGRLGDIFGRRRLFLFGMAAFTIASLLCGLAASPGELIAARLLQGVTAAAMVPQVLGLITAVFPIAERAKALSWFGVIVGLGSIAGQVVGGLLLDVNLFGWGWRTIFLVNVPVGIIALAFAVRLLPTTPPARRPRLDVVGAVGVSAGIALALVPLVLGRSQGWPLWGWISMAAALPVLAAVVAWERRLGRLDREPLFDLRLFTSRTFSVGMVIYPAFMGAFASFMFALTLVLQGGLGLSPLDAGLVFGPLGLAFALTSILGRGIAGRRPAMIATVGASISFVSVTVLAVLLAVHGSGIGVGMLIAPMTLVGFGNGLVIPALLGASLAGVDPREAGAASGVLTTAQQFGSAAGVAAIGAVFFAVLGGHPARGDYASALAAVAAFDAALILLVAGLTRALRIR